MIQNAGSLKWNAELFRKGSKRWISPVRWRCNKLLCNEPIQCSQGAIALQQSFCGVVPCMNTAVCILWVFSTEPILSSVTHCITTHLFYLHQAWLTHLLTFVQELYIWDLFSQNERQVARKLKEIQLFEHFKSQDKTKEFLKKIINFGPQMAATLAYYISF